MKKITEITTEREFISKLRTYYRKARRKGYQRNEISFLGLMEYTGSATREFEYQSDKYFSVGIRAYDWQHGNSLLSALIDKWENEIEAEKRKKQPDTLTEAPQISTETAETANISAEGEEGEERAEIAITSIVQLNVLKYKLQHPRLKEWAVKYGLLDLVRNMYCAPELSLGGLWIDNKFRQSLCENDKSIIAAVRKLIADAEKAA